MKTNYFAKFKEAQEKRKLYQDFNLVGIDVRLSNISMQGIMIGINDLKYRIAKEYREEKGYGDDPVDEKKWSKYLVDRREALVEQNTDESGKIDKDKIDELMVVEEDNKPVDEAERVAGAEATSRAMLEILPTFFTNPVTGEKMFEKGSEELAGFIDILNGDMLMIKVITENFVALQEKTNELTETVKNSLGEDSSPIMSSGADLESDSDSSPSVKG